MFRLIGPFSLLGCTETAPRAAQLTSIATGHPFHQQVVTSRLTRHLSALTRHQIPHGAVVVMHHRTGEITALASGTSSAAAYSTPRDPGSMLKPFIYGMALEATLIQPDTMLPDLPSDYDGYQPHNYDGQFHGWISAKDALHQSLNLPFVYLVDKLGVEQVVGELVSLGAYHMDHPPGYFNVSVAMGQRARITPLQLVRLYGAIADQGQVRSLYFQKPIAEQSPIRMWSPRTARLVRAALSSSPNQPGLFWKTGTSLNHHDAWAGGANQHYTAVVWLGNLAGSPSKRLVGRTVALPLLLEILRSLPTLPHDQPPSSLW
ncbi:MAG: hypothetical protein KTR25_00150 [Myxococcales bacterium]|nr:hypothetical protein [Myxococcales bacterium]